MAVTEAFPTLDVEKIREDFPVLSRLVHGKPLIYLDSAATSQKPESVITAEAEFYRNTNANVHRGIYQLSIEATEAYEAAREKIARFINARSPREIVFTKSTTEALNLLRYVWAGPRLKAGDEVLSTVMEHHSNLIPWQSLQNQGAILKHVDIRPDGTLSLEDFHAKLTDKTKLFSVTHCSNVLGTINPIRELARELHRVGGILIADGAQSVPHMPVDVQALDCDFLAFSGHKMLGPTGIGVLYGKEKLLEQMAPFLTGGEMVREVKLRSATWNEIPYKFEGGTSNIAGAVGLGAAVDYLEGVGMSNIRAHDRELIGYALDEMGRYRDLKLYGPLEAEKRGGAVAFNLSDIHAHDVAQVLDADGIAIRSGHHCAQPLMERLGCIATARVSTYLYNTEEEIDAFLEGLQKVREVFAP